MSEYPEGGQSSNCVDTGAESKVAASFSAADKKRIGAFALRFLLDDLAGPATDFASWVNAADRYGFEVMRGGIDTLRNGRRMPDVVVVVDLAAADPFRVILLRDDLTDADALRSMRYALARVLLASPDGIARMVDRFGQFVGSARLLALAGESAADVAVLFGKIATYATDGLPYTEGGAR